MNYKTFYRTLMERLPEVLSEGITITPKQVKKNNNITLDALVIASDSHKMCPTLYPRQFFTSYKHGMSMDELLAEIKEMVTEHMSRQEPEFDLFTSYDKAKEYLAYRLINYDYNRELLATVPHRRFLDLAIVYYLALDCDSYGKGSVLLSHEHVSLFHVSEDILYQDATGNTAQILPNKIRSIMDVILEISEAREMFKDGPGIEDGDYPPLYVLTNSLCFYGAAAILYRGVLAEFAKEHEADLIILPSSIHEVLLMPVNNDIRLEELKEMVRSINEQEVALTEQLSNHVYLYHRERDTITL